MKIAASSEVERLLANVRLTAEACLTIFPAGIGETDKKPAVVRICGGRMELPPLTPAALAPSPKTVLRMKTRGRLLVNHGGGVLENANLCLHPHFGCPYISGSAVKGIARHDAWCQWDDARKAGLSADENPDDLSLCIVDLFGFPTGNRELDEAAIHAGHVKKGSACAGSVAFLPAFPTTAEPGMLEPDILNSHERRNLVPVYFPAVRAGVEFEFAIAAAGKPSLFGDGASELAVGFLRSGLENHGIGAKTNAGYGWFEEVEP
ncbi:MAG: type III-B CRISPR module RAMP protein Cmr6 [Verrucomicrobia bacterium A1]|nr:MAG: type III-B CRISPR module RAMP protein Cmr6 [Verrucomicrobia bacterium A1]